MDTEYREYFDPAEHDSPEETDQQQAEQRVLPTSLDVLSLPTSRLKPNPWNPNRHTAESRREYTAEVRRLGRLPRPIIVRPSGDLFQIIDGEHGYDAAIEVGLQEVPCEIVDADDFDSMLQTYKRNRGGKDNPVLLGRMFTDMQESRNLSIRAVSREIGVPESTIRAAQRYAQAAELRSACADADADAVTEIGNLSHRELDVYLGLPEGVRDTWVDAGAQLAYVTPLYEVDVHQIAAPLRESGLGRIVGRWGFRDSLRLAVDLSRWRGDHEKLEYVDEFVNAVADIRIGEDKKLPSLRLLDYLPCKVANGSPQALLSPDEWSHILQRTAERAVTPAAMLPLVQTAVRVVLKKRGIDLDDVLAPGVAEVLHLVDEGPEFIRKAAYLTLDEQATLIQITTSAPDEMVLSAKRLTCKHFRDLRQLKKGSKRPRKNTLGGSVEQVFRAVLSDLVQDRERAAEEELFADRARVIDAVVDKLSTIETVTETQIGKRPAIDVLRDQLSETQLPALTLLAGSVLHCAELNNVARHWLRTFQET